MCKKNDKSIGIHITHEAAKKVGGIGSVLAGLCNSHSYQERIDNTLFYGPLFDDFPVDDPNKRLDKHGKVYLSTIDNLYDKKHFPQNRIEKLKEVVKKYGIELVFGTKEIFDELHPEVRVEVDVMLVGVQKMKKREVDICKYWLWEEYKFSSENFTDWDFEQYLRIAVPFYEILNILYENSKELQFFCFAHEYMGIVSCLSLIKKVNCRTYFYAHEVSPARGIVEKEEGHDLSFYHFLENDVTDLNDNESNRIKVDKTMEERFGNLDLNYRSQLIKLAKYMNEIIAVGDFVKKEYCYLEPEADPKKIKIIYNGIPVQAITYEKKIRSRAKIINYCERLYNYSPDVIFTHITRLVVSKGLWRDIKFLHSIDDYFYQKKIKGFYILLSTLIATGRPQDDILSLEKRYGWPVNHEKNWPDLVGYENDVYESLRIFNGKSKAIKGVFINQYGFEHKVTGERVGRDNSFEDLRISSDVELGFSIYEPFGIAQIETIPFGGLAFLTRQCGSSFLLEKTFAKEEKKPYYIIDFTKDYRVKMNREERNKVEDKVFLKQADAMFELIPKNETERKYWFELARKYNKELSWDNVTGSMF